MKVCGALIALVEFARFGGEMVLLGVLEDESELDDKEENVKLVVLFALGVGTFELEEEELLELVMLVDADRNEGIFGKLDGRGSADRKLGKDCNAFCPPDGVSGLSNPTGG